MFERTAEVQYTKTLLFSSTVTLMLPVVMGQFRTINQAYAAQTVAVSLRAVDQQKAARATKQLRK